MCLGRSRSESHQVFRIERERTAKMTTDYSAASFHSCLEGAPSFLWAPKHECCIHQATARLCGRISSFLAFKLPLDSP